MEYGAASETIMFYQARLFKLFEGKADFSIERGDGSDATWQSIVTPYNAFGITPQDGIEFKLTYLDRETVEKHKGREAMAYRHGAFFHNNSLGLDVQPGNMKAYLSMDQSLLEHGHYRWMQKSPLTFGMALGDLLGRRKIIEMCDDMPVRFCSNGVNGGYNILAPEKPKKKRRR